MKKDKDIITQIIPMKDFIIIVFSNEIKLLKKTHLTRFNSRHSKELIKDAVWTKVKYAPHSLYWTNYKISGQPFEIGSDTLYNISEAPTNDELKNIILFLINKKRLTKDILQKVIFNII